MFCCCCPGKRLDRIAPPDRAAPSLETLTATSSVGTPSLSLANGGAELPGGANPLRAPNASTDGSTADHNRAFVKALKCGDLGQLIFCLDNGVDMERRGMWENTPLLLACHYGHAAIALELLRRGASAAAVNEKGCTPLLYACVESMAEVVRQLLEQPQCDPQPAPAPVYSRLTDQTAARTPLAAAAENGAVPALVMLLQRGAPPSQEALLLAATYGHTAACEALLASIPYASCEAGQALQDAKSAALLQAARRGHLEVAQAIMRHQPPLPANAVGSALCAACELGASQGGGDAVGGVRAQLVMLLAGESAAVDWADAEGNSPLHIAAQRGLEAEAAALLASGASPTHRNHLGQSPADVATLFRHAPLASTLAAAAASRAAAVPTLAHAPAAGLSSLPKPKLPPLGPAPAADGRSQLAPLPPLGRDAG